MKLWHSFVHNVREDRLVASRCGNAEELCCELRKKQDIKCKRTNKLERKKGGVISQHITYTLVCEKFG